jgi:hypothetical protein
MDNNSLATAGITAGIIGVLGAVFDTGTGVLY